MAYCCFGQHENEAGALWCRECGSLVAGAMLGEYHVLSYVGKGSMAEVYLAEQPSLNRRKVVIKILPHELPDARTEAFQREASVLASLAHPYILPIFDYGVLCRTTLPREEVHHRGQVEEDGSEVEQRERCLPYLVLAYAERGSLADIFAREGNRPWSLDRVVKIAREIAEALDYAHGRGVLHRDVKPANILLSGTHVLLSDFSVATLIDADVSHLTAPWAGSPAYMAPEVWQLRAGRYSDQYSLAITCYHLLTGELPLRRNEAARARSWAHVHAFVPSRSILELRPELPVAVDLVLRCAMSKNPHDRYATITAFAADLLAAAQDGTRDLVSLIDTRAIGRKTRARASYVGNEPKAGEWSYEEQQPQVNVAFAGAVARPIAITPPADMHVRYNTPAVADAPQAPRYWIDRQQQLPLEPSPLIEARTDMVASGEQYDRWGWYVLLLNSIIALALVVLSALEGQAIQDALYLVLALWPALLVGPLLAAFFHTIRYSSLSWGLFWGMFFGLANGLLSTLVCLAWFAVVLLVAGMHCRSGCSASDGLAYLLQTMPQTASYALFPIVLGLWISTTGGALIGIFHRCDEL